MVRNLVYTEVFWSGFCNLEHIIIQNANVSEFEIQNKQIDSLWDSYRKNYPDSYDGKLLYLKSFEFEVHLDETSTLLFLDIGYLRYSTLIGIQTLQLQTPFYGIIGTQIAVFSPDEEYVLVGKRKLNQNYAPGLLTFPGGMLELSDLNLSSKEIFLRELVEEIDIQIKKPKLIALLSEHTNHSIIFLISAKIDQTFSKDEVFLENENEFENNELYWLKITELKDFKTEELMEGLSFFKIQE